MNITVTPSRGWGPGAGLFPECSSQEILANFGGRQRLARLGQVFEALPRVVSMCARYVHKDKMYMTYIHTHMCAYIHIIHIIHIIHVIHIIHIIHIYIYVYMYVYLCVCECVYLYI